MNEPSICIVDASNPLGHNGQYFNFKGYNSYEDGKWRSWHSFAACLQTEFFPYNGENFNACFKYDAVIVLLDKDFEKVLPFIKKLKLLKKKIAVSLHEGIHIVENPQNLFQLNALKKIVNENADFFLSYNTPYKNFYSYFFKKVIDIPMCYPFFEWDVSSLGLTPREKKEGIIVLTRTLDQSYIKRNTMFALTAAIDTAENVNTFVTYVNQDPDFTNDFLKDLFGDRLIIEKRKDKYVDWLKLLSKHRVGVQLDSSNSHGQVVADCVMTDTFPLGGNCDNSILTSTNINDLTSLQNRIIDHYVLFDCVKIRHRARNLIHELSFEKTKEKILHAFNNI